MKRVLTPLSEWAGLNRVANAPHHPFAQSASPRHPNPHRRPSPLSAGSPPPTSHRGPLLSPLKRRPLSISAQRGCGAPCSGLVLVYLPVSHQSALSLADSAVLGASFLVPGDQFSPLSLNVSGLACCTAVLVRLRSSPSSIRKIQIIWHNRMYLDVPLVVFLILDDLTFYSRGRGLPIEAVKE
jgi:hypothetical protein